MTEVALYPLKFKPIGVPKIWGGHRLCTLLNKGFGSERIGESWEIADLGDRVSTVASGPLKGKSIRSLIGAYRADLIGEKAYAHGDSRFPLLIKLIDAEKPLSIQVHPPDALAKARHQSAGKTEMWYVIHAAPNSELILGFSHTIDEQAYLENLERKTLENILQKRKVRAGDWFYLPAGRVHAIGAGVLLAEIQQNSDITYRIYDYDRKDPKTGKKRELHTELALAAIDFSSVGVQPIHDQSLICPYFKVELLRLTKRVDRKNREDSFIVFTGAAGSSYLNVDGTLTHLTFGETVLLPAKFKHFSLEPAEETSRVLQITA